MMRHDLPATGWRKSSYSSDSGPQCVEFQPAPQGLVAVRDSKNPALGAHAFTAEEWMHFVDAVRNGEFGL